MKQISNKNEFNNIINEIITNSKVQEMKLYLQHCDTSTYEHCYNAAYYCYKICKKLKLDYKSATRAAMLHDFYLYDWHIKDKTRKLHAFAHGKIAYINACKIFSLNDKEKDIITNHMWPVTISIPKTREGIILTLIDKYCALKETKNYILKLLSTKKVYKYASIFFYTILFKL